MDFKKMRLKHLVNENFYPKLNHKNEESEVINRYDSDEEAFDSDFEDGYELNNSKSNILSKNKSLLKIIQTENFDDDEDKTFQTAQKITTKNFYTSSFRTTDKKFTRDFEKFEEDQIDEEMLELLENLNKEQINNQIENILIQFEEKKNFGNSKNVIFFANYFQFFLTKLSSDISEINNLTLNKISKSADDLLNILFKLIPQPNEIKEKFKNSERLIYYMLSIGDNLLDIMIKKEIKKNDDLYFLSNLIELLLTISDKNSLNILNEEDNFYYNITKMRIKNSMINLNKLIKNSYQFTHDQTKNIFNFSFNFLRQNNLSNIFISLVENICGIINSRNEFIDKFLENMLTLFYEFTDYYNFNEDKFYCLDKRVIYNFKFYFGVYKCHNGDNISLFTLLFLKFFGNIYNNNLINEDQNLNIDFTKIFETFIIKVLESKTKNILLIFYCILDDLMNIKYNSEFSITLIIITNLFICFSNLISHSDFELSKRKFFMNCLEYFIENLLEDFGKMRETFLCIGAFRDGNNNNCNCFSCVYSFNSNINLNEFCTTCKWNTNLKLNLNNITDNNDIQCGFCNIKNYFENISENLFSQEKSTELNLIETNEEIIKEFSKNKENNNKDEYYDKLLNYQDSLYKNSFTFLKCNIINYLKIYNKNENSFYSNNLDLSFKIFLKVLISDQKMSLPIYQNFSENILKFYECQKERVFNFIQDVTLDQNLINYFYFYYFYINFIFAGHWRLLDFLINEDYSNLHWFIRYKSLKILDKILIFEGENKIFQNFNLDMLIVLLNDSSFYVKEYSLEILFKLYKFKKIERNKFINILFENINESSFLIRKRIVKTLIGLIIEEKDNIEKETFKTINFILLNKIIDESESNKIKSLIYDFYFKIFNNNQNMTNYSIEIFIEILKENEEGLNNSLNLYEHFKNLFTVLILDKKLKNKDLMGIIDFIFTNYILNQDEENDKINLIQSLNLIKIITSFNSECIIVYFESLLEFLIINNEINENVIIENKIKQIICEIFGNILTQANVKSKYINNLENLLIRIILSKPSQLMISAIDCYCKILSRGLINYEKIKELSYKNYLFLKNQIIDVNNNKNNPPLPIISKALTFLAYLTYASDSEQLSNIYESMETYKIFQQKSNNPEKIICENIFNIYKNFSINHPNNLIKFRTFEALGFFWIRFPQKLSNSQEIIESIFLNVSNDEEKLILLRTFINFFTQITEKIKKLNSENNSDLDLGGVHLFFENFINNFSQFLINETNPMIRLQTINLIKLIINLGNVNVHNILPFVFASLSDHVNEIRHISANILEKIIKISKEKFLNFIKECLKINFQFQKKIYKFPNLINSFVKINEENEFVNHNENIFELLSYKIVKSIKDENFNKKILIKFIQNFLELKNIENEVNLQNLNDCVNKFEYFEYVASLIGDFKFSNHSEIILIFQQIFKEFSSEILYFQTKFKEYLNSSNIKIENRLLLLFFTISLKSSLFKFLLAKYDNFDNYEEIINKNFDNFIETFNNDIENVGKNKLNILSFSKELKNFRFYQFYNSSSIFIKKIMKIVTKINFTLNDKNKIVDLMKMIKDFYNLKTEDVRLAVTKYKKKLSKFNEEKADEFLSEILFHVKKVNKNKNSDLNESKIKIKIKNSLSEVNIVEEKQNSNKLANNNLVNNILTKIEEDKLKINKNNLKTNKRRISLEEEIDKLNISNRLAEIDKITTPKENKPKRKKKTNK